MNVKFGQITSGLGVYDWTRYDQVLDLFDGYRLEYALGQAFGGVVPDLAHWEEYCAAIATRSPADTIWTLGNEWDQGIFWPGTEPQAFAYMMAASNAIKAVRPNAVILSNGTTAPGYQWLDRALTANGTGWITGVAFHPYVQPYEPETIVALVNNYRAVMASHGIGSMPLYANEVTWHQYRVSGVLTNTEFPPDPTAVEMSGALAAAYVARTHLVCLAKALRGVTWYDDFAYNADANDFSQVPLYDEAGTTLVEGGQAYEYLASLLSGARLGSYRLGGLHHLSFSKGGVTGKALWMRDGETQVEDLTSWASGTDVLGDPITLTSTYEVTQSPIYVFD